MKAFATLKNVCTFASWRGIPPPPSAAAVLNAQIQQLAKQSTIMGHVRTIFSKLNVSPAKAKMILLGLSRAVHWEELLFFYFMGWMFVPTIAIPSKRTSTE